MSSSSQKAALGLGSRAEALERLASSSTDPLDLLVVGGGITGAGIALDAASRGASVGLVERFDFASGTSSKSSKLVHGGLRYLEQREFGLMREACTERDLLRRLAPHLVEPLAFVLPVSGRSTRAKFGVGLWAYDALASFRNLKLHKHLDGEETERLVPALPEGKVKGGYIYYDCKTDDVRLVMENLIQARRYGATVANYAVVRDLGSSAHVCKAIVEDSLTGEMIEISARRIVVAAGVWADHVESLAQHRAQPRLRPSKGVHLVFDRSSVPTTDAGAFIPDAERKRMLFVIPWHDHVLVGTTDDSYEGSLDHPSVDASDRAYCIDALNANFGLELTESDIVGAYAGLRPLVMGERDATADLSRRHAVYDITPGITGITGGKLTTYRRMATDAVDKVSEELGMTSKSRTRWIRLGSRDLTALRAAVARRCRAAGLGMDVAENLVRTYGDRALDVLALAHEEGLTARLVEGSRSIAAEVAYCVRAEMATHLSDVLARRTRLALIDQGAGVGSGATAAQVMASEYSWSRRESRRQIDAHRAEVTAERGIPMPEVDARGVSRRTSRVG
ncbi:MAG: glycerol-3-phosphate dehydrogenase/oxidase [Actinomycetota bacterium]